MRFKLTLTMIISMTIAVLVALTVIYRAQASSDTNATMLNSKEKLSAMHGKLLSNDEEIERLKENVSENCLAKARAVSNLLALAPDKKSDKAWLEKMCKDLQVSEIHIIDSKGIITHSTVDAYVGFDMGSGEQSGAFLKILEDPSYELAQEPQMNAAAGVVVQYAGVARSDEKGLVQIGVEPRVLAEAISGKDINTTLKEFDLGAQGFTFSINKDTGLIEVFGDDSYVGKSAKEVGFPAELSVNGKVTLNGVVYLGITDTYKNEDGEHIVGIATPYSIVEDSSRSAIGSTSIALIAINLLLLIALNFYVSKAIVGGIRRIGANVQKISDGDYAVEFKENNNKEFRQLSAGLNKMTESIRLSTEQMTDASQALSNATNTALSGMNEIQLAVKDIAENANKQAGDMSVAVDNVALIGDRIYNTSQLASNLGGHADTMIAESAVAKDAMNNLKDITEKVVKAVDDISVFASNTSISAQNIFDAASMIDSVAKQTRLLSFNASIEAARAGDAGKGFGVVAEEIQRLADQTGKASSSITSIIEELMGESGQLVESMSQMKDIMDKQKSNLDDADSTVGKMINGVDATMAGIKEIEQLTGEINEAKDSLREIIESLTSIAQSNAASTEETDAQLADTADIFRGMQVYADKLKEVAER